MLLKNGPSPQELVTICGILGVVVAAGHGLVHEAYTIPSLEQKVSELQGWQECALGYQQLAEKGGPTAEQKQAWDAAEYAIRERLNTLKFKEDEAEGYKCDAARAAGLFGEATEAK